MNFISKHLSTLICLCFSVGSISAQIAASTADQAKTDDSEPLILDAISVIGSKHNLERLPGSGSFVDTAEIRDFGYDDLNQVIRRIPGVYIRQEDGYGLFPNVSLRGVSTTRNSKITIMEDGILMAPAAYSAPAAYYSPNVGRMSGLEILKGSSQIKYGPETTGGVINYLSTPIPTDTRGFLGAAYGSNNDIRVHANYGGTSKTNWGSFGYLVENVYRETDGFKTINATSGGGYACSDNTGFSRNEHIVKFRFDLDAGKPQSIEFKYGRSDIDADETYLGLTEIDIRNDPHQRYAATRYDNIATEQERLSLRYALRATDDLKLRLTAYQTTFARNWYKLNDAGTLTSGFKNASESLAGAHGNAQIDVLKGDAAGYLRIRANNRTYEAQGLEAHATWDIATDTASHRIQAGLRFHQDFIDRFQWQDIYTQANDGSATLSNPGTPGTQSNRRAESDALAFFIQDTITMGRLAITPGIRIERIDYTDIRRSTNPASLSTITALSEKTLTTAAPGIGFTWQADQQTTWFGGMHRGISPPGPGSAGNTLEEETSLSFETGIRFNNQSNFSSELVVFRTAFNNLIVEANAGGGGSAGVTQNIGQVDSTGVELTLAYDPSISRGWDFRNPWNFSATYSHAVLGNDVNASGNSGDVAESIFSGGRNGNELPYIPTYQLALGTGIEKDAWGIFAAAYYQPSTYASANNEHAQINPDASSAAGLQPRADSRYGSVDAFFLLDLSVHYRLNERTKLKLAITNLLDREYISSRVPIGPRPGPPRTATAGIELKF